MVDFPSRSGKVDSRSAEGSQGRGPGGAVIPLTVTQKVQKK